LNTDEASGTVGEFAFGINSKARFVDEFLEAEKVLGTVHIAFGDNSDMPSGKNTSKNHMDLLMSRPTVRITNMDRSAFKVLGDGVFQQL
jgi:leucyl aminopeptidase (aminopeptidase T)